MPINNPFDRIVGGTGAQLVAPVSGTALTYNMPTVAPTAGQGLVASAPVANVVTLSWSTIAAVPAGVDGNVQFNSAGAFGANANFNFTTATNTLTLPGFTYSGNPQTLALSSAADQVALTIASTNSLTNTVNPMVDIQLGQAGATAANFGAQIRVGLKTTTTANQDAATFNVIWTTATHASRTSALLISTVNNAVGPTEVCRFSGASVSFSVDALPATTQKLGSATLPWLSTFTGSTTQYESVVSSAGLITHAALGSATDISIVLTPKGTGAVLASSGLATTPSYSFAAQTTTGLFLTSGNVLGIAISGTGAAAVFGGVNLTLQSAIGFGVSSGDPTAAGADTNISRISAGLWGVGTGAAGSFAGSLKLTDIVQVGKSTTYNNIATAGLGHPAIYSAPPESATKTGNFTVLSYTPPATAGTYEVNGVITTTSSTNTGTIQFTLDYRDSQGTVHTADIIPLCDASGVIATTKTGASKQFHAMKWQFSINNAATAIVLKVVITGSVSYTVTGSIEQIN